MHFEHIAEIDATDTAFFMAGGGGGGSGFGPAGTQFETGVREGDGQVTISYDPMTDSCPPAPAPAPTPAPVVVTEVRFTG